MPDRITTVAETGSTSADLLAGLRAGEPIEEGRWLVARRQHAGRGRQGRTWLDAPGNFMGSTAVMLQDGDPPPASLSFVAALAVYEAVLPYVAAPRALQLKWPNDLLLGGQKICGILLEREGRHAVIGIGVNLAVAPAAPDRVTRSLAEAGSAPRRDHFASALARQFEEELRKWRGGGLQLLFARWLAAAHPIGTPLIVHNAAGERVAGAFDGLEPDGALRLRLADGGVRAIHAGDVELEGG